MSSKPTTLAECFRWLDENLTEKQISNLHSLSKEELWQTHFSIVPIVKQQIIDDNPALQERFGESAFCDDPDIAGQVVDAYWDHLRITRD